MKAVKKSRHLAVLPSDTGDSRRIVQSILDEFYLVTCDVHAGEQKILEMIQKVRFYFQYGDYDMAEKILDILLDLYDNNREVFHSHNFGKPEMLRYKGSILMSGHQLYGEAEKVLMEALDETIKFANIDKVNGLTAEEKDFRRKHRHGEDIQRYFILCILIDVIKYREKHPARAYLKIISLIEDVRKKICGPGEMGERELGLIKKVKLNYREHLAHQTRNVRKEILKASIIPSKSKDNSFSRI